MHATKPFAGAKEAYPTDPRLGRRFGTRELAAARNAAGKLGYSTGRCRKCLRRWAGILTVDDVLASAKAGRRTTSS